MPKDLPTPQVSPSAGEATSGSPFDDGILDAAEKKRIRDMLSSALTFLASRRLLPTFLVRIGPLKVLLPIVWGLGFLKSRRWVAGFTFLGVGLFSLAMAFKPGFQFETVSAGDADHESVTDEEEITIAEKQPSKVSSFLRPAKDATTAKTISTTSKPAVGSSFREPIFTANDARKGPEQHIRPAVAISANGAKQGGVWLLGTIEEVKENELGRRTASAMPFPRSEQ